MIRLKKIASLVTKNASVIDIGTDHAYLPIYLYQNNITRNVAASDISKKVLESTRKNITDAGLLDKIEIIESDGFKNITEAYDEAIIAGMGTNTIKKILNSSNRPDSLIISTHNNLYELRLFMQNLGYKIIKEVVVKENDIFYDIIKYHKGKDALTEEQLLFGKSYDKEYLNYLKNKYQNLLSKSNDSKYLNYINLIERILDLRNQ